MKTITWVKMLASYVKYTNFIPRADFIDTL